MVILLTFSLVLLGLGLTLLVMAFTGRRPSTPSDLPPGSPEAYQAELAEAGKRRLRPIPLVLGLILAIAGGIGAAMILQGPESKYDDLVLGYWPANRLVDDLNSDDPARRSDAFRELSRRNEENSLSSGALDRLIDRQIAKLTNSTEAPEAPIPNAPVVEIDLVKARKENRIEPDRWADIVARTSPLRLDVPRRAALDDPMQLRLVASLGDPTAPAWVIIKVESLLMNQKPIELPPPVAVAPNPDWTPPPPPEPVDPNQASDGGAAAFGVGGRGPRPVIRRVVRYETPVPAEVLAAIGAGTHPVTGKIRVYAFDSTVVPPPLELLTDTATGAGRGQPPPAPDVVAAVLSAQLTPEQFNALTAKSMATWEWPLDRRVELGATAEAPATARGRQPDSSTTQPAEPTTQPAEPTTQPAGGAGEGAGGGR